MVNWKWDTGVFSFKNLNVPLAYLLGAYLTDGCVSEYNANHWKAFTLEVIDRDFAERVQDSINVVTGSSKEITVNENKSRPYFKAYSGNQDLCGWLVEVTDDKHLIPDVVYTTNKEVKRAFISGIMDGDGFISWDKEKDWVGVLGIGTTSLWIFQLWEILRGLGVQVSTPKRETKDRLKPLYRMTINKKTFWKAGLKFTIKRKQDRMNEFALRTGLRSSETKRGDSEKSK